MVALRLECLDLLLPGKLLFQGKRARSGTAGVLDLAVELLDLALQSELEVVGSAIELVRLGLEDPRIAL